MPLVNTPWGRPDEATEYAEGITFYSTPSHGGFHVDRKLVAKIPAPLRGLSGYPDNWYEEDCSWAVVAYVFPEAFLGRGIGDDKEAIQEYAEGVLNRWYPAELEQAKVIADLKEIGGAAGRAARFFGEGDESALTEGL